MVLDSATILRLGRVLLTCYIMFLITWYYEVPERIWCLMTIWFVMLDYQTVGGVRKKGIFRLMGTSISAIYGLFIVYFLKNNVILNMLAFIPLLLWYAGRYLDTDKSYIISIGTVTLTIILFNNNDISSGMLRLFNILLGNIASLIMMIVFYPNFATQQLNPLVEKIIHSQIDILDFLLHKNPTPEKFFIFEKKLQSQLKLLLTTIDEASYEQPHNDTLPNYSKIHDLNYQIAYVLHSILIYKIQNILTQEELLEFNHVLKQIMINLKTPRSIMNVQTIVKNPKYANLKQLIELIQEIEHCLNQLPLNSLQLGMKND